MFLIPEELPRRNIYKFLELMVRKSEEKFFECFNNFENTFNNSIDINYGGNITKDNLKRKRR